MSHFVVMVAVPGNVSREEIQNVVADRLQPFHEFECTGIDDQYVVDVDKTDEAREEYENYTTKMVRRPDGSLVSLFDEQGNYRPEFSREEEDTDFPIALKRKVSHIPEGYAEVEVPTKEVESFEKFAADYYGISRDGDNKYGRIEGEGDNIKIIDRTNPNKKWDYWTIGGRWSGLFLPEGTANDPDSIAPLRGNRTDETEGNIIRKGDWPYHQRMNEAREKWSVRYDAMHAAIDPLRADYRTWEQVRESSASIEEARKAYKDQPLVEAARNVDDPFATAEDKADPFTKGKLIGMFDSVEDYLVPHQQFVDLKAWATVGCYAMLDLEGHWIQKGEMGWWGVDSNHNTEWPKPALDALNDMPDDTWLVSVDCHI